MSMKTFFVKYANEARQIIHSDLESIEAFCNQHFGSAWADAKEFGAHIAMTEHDPDANLADEKYHPMFVPAPSEPPAPTPGPTSAPAPAPTETPAAPGPTDSPAPAPSTGDVVVQITGAESTTALGNPQ